MCGELEETLFLLSMELAVGTSKKESNRITKYVYTENILQKFDFFSGEIFKKPNFQFIRNKSN